MVADQLCLVRRSQGLPAEVITAAADVPPPGGWAALVPELVCSDLARSLQFYTRHCGFEICYQRPGFAYLALGNAQLMLEQGPSDWQTAPPERPYGRGINFQIEIVSLSVMEAGLAAAGISLFRPPETAWYRAGAIEHGQRQLLVCDPDGYLLRFIEVLGDRPAPETANDA
jgi:catechol 2,3-dioxygenase-like lactoylglutathione lyase family enzyme